MLYTFVKDKVTECFIYIDWLGQLIKTDIIL